MMIDDSVSLVCLFLARVNCWAPSSYVVSSYHQVVSVIVREEETAVVEVSKLNISLVFPTYQVVRYVSRILSKRCIISIFIFLNKVSFVEKINRYIM
ncbi:hypothetical protein BDD12DRAFT_824907 [Trichophaea hybrida]|nr:hypothetical protein BDD12DRAFT_824907 [Trichophaea hybrida]